MSDTGTKEAILRAAEQLYAEQGFAGTSLRTITRAAGVNTAAIHYHFGSKEGLVEALIARRAEPVNRTRLAMLDAIEARHPEGPLPLPEVIEAFLAPAIRLSMESPEESEILPRLMARIAMEAGLEARDIVMKVFDEVRRRFVPALCRALPGVPEEEVLWRMHMMIGSMCFAVAVPGAGAFPCRPDDPVAAEELIARIVGFAAAGMRGLVPEAVREDTK